MISKEASMTIKAMPRNGTSLPAVAKEPRPHRAPEEPALPPRDQGEGAVEKSLPIRFKRRLPLTNRDMIRAMDKMIKTGAD